MNDKKNELTVYEKIDNVSKIVGIKNSNKTVLRVKTTDNPDIKEVHLTIGSWDEGEPWFVIDENERIHALVSLDTLTQMIKNLNVSSQENFDLKLERTIWQHFPIDFGDVWVVAMDEIKKMAKKTDKVKAVKIDLDKLVSDIKMKYPSLFVDISAIQNNMAKFKPNMDEIN